MALSFFKNYAGVQVGKAGDELVGLLVRWDPQGATEAERRAIEEKLAQLCVKCEEKRKRMEKEVADVEAVKLAAAQKMKLAEAWQAEIANPATAEDRRKLLEQKLPTLIAELEANSPKIDKEVEEAELARQVFQTYDEAVRVTNEKLQASTAQQEQITAQLDMANTRRDLAKEQVDAARVLQGLHSATDSFGIASAAIQKQTAKLQAETAGMKREAELLGAHHKEDDFVATELKRVTDPGHDKPISDRLAALRSKLS